MRWPRKHENSNGMPYPLLSNNSLSGFLGTLDWGATWPPTNSEFVSETGGIGEKSLGP